MFPEQFMLHVDRPLFSSDSTCLFNVWPKIGSKLCSSFCISPKDYKVKTLDVVTIHKVINDSDKQLLCAVTYKNPQGGMGSVTSSLITGPRWLRTCCTCIWIISTVCMNDNEEQWSWLLDRKWVFTSKMSVPMRSSMRHGYQTWPLKLGGSCCACEIQHMTTRGSVRR